MVSGDVQASQKSGLVLILNRNLSRIWKTRIVTETEQGCESSEIEDFQERSATW